MSRLTRDGTAEPVSRDQILRHARGQGNINFSCSADHEQDWQPYPVDLYSAICDDHTCIHTSILTGFIPISAAASVCLNRHAPSDQSRVYRATQPCTDGIHCRESAGTVVLKVRER